MHKNAIIVTNIFWYKSITGFYKYDNISLTERKKKIENKGK